jgi:hypothetical protein
MRLASREAAAVYRGWAQPNTPEMKTTVPLVGLWAGQAVIAGFARFFDIVNGFFNRCRDASYWLGLARVLVRYNDVLLKMCNI